MPTENRSSNTEMVSDKLPPCADDVFKNGVSACLVGDVPKHAAEKICQSLSAVTGWKIDWHYIGGRTHIKALAPTEHAQVGAAPTDFLLVSHPEGRQWTVESGGKDHRRAARAAHLKIDPLYTSANPDEAKRQSEATAFVQRLVDCAGTQQTVATGYVRDILDVLKGNATPSAPVELQRMTFEYVHADGERRTVSVSRAEVAEHMDSELFEKLTETICHCEPFGETNVVDCRCDEVAEQFELAKPS